MGSTMLSYLRPFEDQCFPFVSLNLVNNWWFYESIQKQCQAKQIIFLLSFLKQTAYQRNYDRIKF